MYVELSSDHFLKKKKKLIRNVLLTKEIQTMWWRMSNRGSDYRITQPREGIKYPESTEGVEHMPSVVQKDPGEGRSRGKWANEDMQSVRGEWLSLFTGASHRKSQLCLAGKKLLSSIQFDLICMGCSLRVPVSFWSSGIRARRQDDGAWHFILA